MEFAVIAPVFLLLLIAFLSYGTYLGASHSTAQLAADAARASVAGLDDAERISIAQNHVARNAATYGILVPEKLSVTAGPLATDPNQFRVMVQYNSEDLPIWAFAELLPLPDKIITKAASIRRGGF